MEAAITEEKGKVKISIYIEPELKQTFEKGAAHSHRSLNQYCRLLMILGYDAETEQLKKLSVSQLNTGKNIWDQLKELNAKTNPALACRPNLSNGGQVRPSYQS